MATLAVGKVFRSESLLVIVTACATFHPARLLVHPGDRRAHLVSARARTGAVTFSAVHRPVLCVTEVFRKRGLGDLRGTRPRPRLMADAARGHAVRRLGRMTLETGVVRVLRGWNRHRDAASKRLVARGASCLPCVF
jgi:hypothetical protein